MKRLLSLLLLAVLLSVPCLTSCGNPVAVLEIEGYGTVEIELYPDYAPETVKNFTSLVKSGFYDGLTFHRVISGFMIQGGDPLGNGTGGSETTIKGEFSNNGVENSLKHERGVISMARSGSDYEQLIQLGYRLSDLPDSYQQYIRQAYNSASSQFFIVHDTSSSSHLDGNYAAFGRVISGMEVVDAIAAVERDANNKPLTPVVITRAYIK